MALEAAEAAQKVLEAVLVMISGCERGTLKQFFKTNFLNIKT